MNVREEDAIQEAIYGYLEKVLPEDAYVFFVDKAGLRSPAQAAALARRGIKSGLPDGRIDWQGVSFAIETKPDKGTLTISQKREFPLLIRAGVKIKICRSVVEAHSALINWGIGPLRHTSLTPEHRDMVWRAKVVQQRAKAGATRALSAAADVEAGTEDEARRKALRKPVVRRPPSLGKIARANAQAIKMAKGSFW